jgi:hypothetical protein
MIVKAAEDGKTFYDVTSKGARAEVVRTWLSRLQYVIWPTRVYFPSLTCSLTMANLR